MTYRNTHQAILTWYCANLHNIVHSCGGPAISEGQHILSPSIDRRDVSTRAVSQLGGTTGNYVVKVCSRQQWVRERESWWECCLMGQQKYHHRSSFFFFFFLVWCCDNETTVGRRAAEVNERLQGHDRKERETSIIVYTAYKLPHPRTAAAMAM